MSESCPTSTWKAGDLLVDRFSATLPFPETFAIKIGFFRPSEADGPWQNLTGAGDLTGVQLGTIAATAPE